MPAYRPLSSLRLLHSVLWGMLRSVLRAMGASLLGLATSLAAHGAGDDAPMHWLLSDMPPGTRIVDGRPTDGIADQVLLYLAGQHPARLQIYEPVNVRRSELMLRQGVAACHAAMMWSPQRAEEFNFVETHRLPPLHLVVRRDRLARVPRNASGLVDLQALVERSGLRGGVVAGRSYGGFMDDWLAREGQGLPRHALPDQAGRLLRMAARDRIDYLFEFDFILRYEQGEDGELRQLVSLPLQGADALMPAGIVCPRTAWGDRVTQQLREELARPAGIAAREAGQRRWMTHEAEQFYRVQLDSYFRRARQALR